MKLVFLIVTLVVCVVGLDSQPTILRRARRSPQQPTDVVKQRTKIIEQAIQKHDFSMVADMIDDDTYIRVHSLLPYNGVYKGESGFEELSTRCKRLIQYKDIKTEIVTVSEDRFISIIHVDFAGTFSNGVQFQQGSKCFVFCFNPLDGTLKKVIVTDLSQHLWAELYLPRPQRVVCNATVEALRYHNNLPNSLDKYFSPQVVLTTHVYPRSALLPQYDGFQGLLKGYKDLMNIIASSTCPFGVQIGEVSRSLDGKKGNSTVSLREVDQPSSGRMTEEQLNVGARLACKMKIRILSSNDTDFYMIKTFKGCSNQRIYEHITVDDNGLISKVDFTLAECLKPWEIYRALQTQPAVEKPRTEPPREQPRPEPPRRPEPPHEPQPRPEPPRPEPPREKPRPEPPRPEPPRPEPPREQPLPEPPVVEPRP